MPILPRILQALYLVDEIESIHVVSQAEAVFVRAYFDREGRPRSLDLPAGHYLIVRLADAPSIRPDLSTVKRID